jgi:hypothetical protein
MRLGLPAAVLAAAFVLSCQVRGAQVAQSPLLRFFERPSGLLAYVAPDGNIAVIDQKGGRGRALTDDASLSPSGSVVYAAPTWSPDGALVAYARVTLDAESTVLESALFSEGRDGKDRSLLLHSTTLQPFYLYWTPDSRRVGILSGVTGQSAMELGVAGPGADGSCTPTWARPAPTPSASRSWTRPRRPGAVT